MPEPPTISAVIPCFNAGRWLGEALDSVARQTRPPIEVIVVDDASTDGSAEIARTYGGPVRLVRQDRNRGVSAARNRGIAEARGEWIAFLDADDLWKPAKLARQAAAIGAADRSVTCVHGLFTTFGVGMPERVITLPRHDLSPYPAVDTLVRWTVWIGTAAVRRDAALANPFPENARVAEDQMFFAALRLAGPFVRIEEVLAGYRQHPDQQMAMPGSRGHSFRTRLAWFRANRHRFGAGDGERLGAGLADQFAAMRREAERSGEDADLRDLDAIAAEIATIEHPSPAADRRPRIFLVGHNRTGTRSLHRFFLANGLRSVHWDFGRLAVTIDRNLSHGRPPLEGYDDFDAFGDMESIATDRPDPRLPRFDSVPGRMIYAYRRFDELDRQYPGSLFIHNTRPLDGWISSRMSHEEGRYAEACRTILATQTGNPDFSLADLRSQWAREFEEHAGRLRAHFGDSPRFLEVDITRPDAGDRIARFLERHGHAVGCRELPHVGGP
jgi:glycosyltransferase involved in cell wall biosynthesis